MTALGWRTDLEVLRLSGARIEEYGDHLVIRSPDNPWYYWGNFVCVTDERACDDASRWVGTFRSAFPAADHVAIGLPAPPDPEPWEAEGLVIETDEVLATDSMPQRRPAPAGYTVRPLISAADWQSLANADIADNLRTGAEPAATYPDFAVRSAKTKADLCATGRAAYFAAFDDAGELAASLGIVLCDELARYQSVATDHRQRRRGLAGHLLGVAAQWAGDRGATDWVIVTESDNPAGRLYRSVGFVPAASSYQAFRSPPPAPGPQTAQ